MNFEKIEQAYELILENSQLIENDLKTHIYDAIVEQNSFYLGAQGASPQVAKNIETLKALQLTKEEWRQAYQFVLIKAGKTEPLQANHQFTPDAIGFIMLYILETLSSQESLDVLEIGSGTGNLAQTILNHSHKSIDYLGIELDDLLIDLSASIAEIMGSSAQFIQEDAVRPQLLKESDMIISDLPVGFYPNDDIASRYQVASSDEHTYAHHLLIEQALKYLKKDGFAIFLAPVNLLSSPQSHLLKQWLKGYAQVAALITLPEAVFGNPANAKSIIVLCKQSNRFAETFVYPISDLKSVDNVRDFMENFKNWKRDNVI
ncbi:TPA: class I SAM-dependent methyltransferase [Streptococcus equi subsp. zooepidemicus]|uniref:class I SAM-dependent methyltransferase n=1 Tax=Streptococcus equi TaxID=1336 RepID=UPI001E4EEEE3|nr:class I SAM-dependent methyltransferase [Streptococcus equi]MCD3369962.1 class I SAM-dependent methyltransferase [Streptococcus equi subsp. zooepidemicus]HEL0564971.1 class I SAM-dependent methyltransferase [Streptococcus equi subsp. zooepidemicus]HEL0745734.1 class I SAM-dependent methyltransferase [Streptococcus equi subsp. zooepidemicus]HEL0782095.1 class I SAM-dependent methyltransferase [Streptococcus equi subsp. zooepidemicus]HEL0803511.1 class I SAM-dependent methyltransferase [Strep